MSKPNIDIEALRLSSPDLLAAAEQQADALDSLGGGGKRMARDLREAIRWYRNGLISAKCSKCGKDSAVGLVDLCCKDEPEDGICSKS